MWEQTPHKQKKALLWGKGDCPACVLARKYDDARKKDYQPLTPLQWCQGYHTLQVISEVCHMGWGCLCEQGGMRELWPTLDWVGWREEGLECTKMICLCLTGVCGFSYLLEVQPATPLGLVQAACQLEKNRGQALLGNLFCCARQIKAARHHVNQEHKLCEDAFSRMANHPGGL